MSGPPRLRSVNTADVEPQRPALGPGGNKKTMPAAEKLLKKSGKPEKESEKIASALSPSPSPKCGSNSPKVPDRYHALLGFPMSASCSSEASSSDSSSAHSIRAARRRGSATPVRRRQYGGPKAEKVEIESVFVSKIGGNAVASVESEDCFDNKKRCAWITHNTEQCYVAFHDEEWGVSVHEDKKLFELLSLSGALAELPWPAILNKRHIFREVFLNFDPIAVSKLNEKKIIASGSLASSLLSELKLRAIFENARQMCKVIEEFGSFDKYIWSFVNHKPIVSQFRYPRQVPVKTPKAEAISKDLVRRGFRSVGPTIVYTFMQVAGLTNDHLTNCFRFQDCLAMAEGKNCGDIVKSKTSTENQMKRTVDKGFFSDC